MKRIIKSLGIIVCALCFFACDNGNSQNDSEPLEIELDGLTVNGKELGSEIWQASVSENTITWDKGTNQGNCGWNLAGLNLSNYDRVRVELESTELPLKLILKGEDGSIVYDYPVEKNIFEAYFDGTCASSKETTLDKSKGFSIYLFSHTDDGQNHEDEKKTVVKSIQFFSGESTVNSSLKIDNAPLQVFWFSYVHDGGVIEWLEPEGAAGWDVKGHDLSAYKKIRIETEGDAPFRIRLMMSDGTHAFYWSKKDTPGIFIANLDGSEAEYYTQNLTAGSVVEKIQLVCEGQIKAGSKTTVKSVSLLTE